MSVCSSAYLETCVGFVIPRPSRVSPQRLAASFPRHPARRGPLGARARDPAFSLPLNSPAPACPAPGGGDPGRLSLPGSERRAWAPSPLPHIPSRSLSRPTCKRGSPLRSVSRPRPHHGSQRPAASCTRPQAAGSRPPSPRHWPAGREVSLAAPPVPDPCAGRSPCAPRHPIWALPQRSRDPHWFCSPLFPPPPAAPGRQAPEPLRRPALRPPVPRVRTSGSPPPPPPPSLPPPAAPSRPLASPPCALGRADGARLRRAQTALLHTQERGSELRRPGAAREPQGCGERGARPGSGAAAALRSGKRRLSRGELNFTGAGRNPAVPSASIPPALLRRGHLCGVRLGVLSPGGRRTRRSGAGSLCSRSPTGQGSAVCRAPRGPEICPWTPRASPNLRSLEKL